MDLTAYHAHVQARIDALDFPALLPSFHAYPFALYTHEAVCLDGRMQPYSPCFLGNTAILHEERHIAIWNLEADPIEDPDLLTSQLVHEMFHCHQQALGESRYPSDLAMLAAPTEPAFYRLKHLENCLLANAYEHADAEAFHQFAAVRQARQTAFPDAVAQELHAETIEGAAEYAGLRTLCMLDKAKFAAQVQGHLRRLRAEDDLLFDGRRLCYSSGAVLMLALARLGHPPVNEIACPLTIWEQNLPSSEGDAIASALHTHQAEYRAILDTFLLRAKFSPCEATICGYDPMNMFRVADVLFCRHFVCLQTGSSTQCITQPVALTLVPGTNDQITGYYKED